MRKPLFLLFAVPFFAKAQETGIKFEKELNWQEVKKMAKAEKKFIFVDCFATWCGPCKIMDKEIYPQDSVGYLVNAKFISVKVQMDTSEDDNDQVKKWYAESHTLQQKFKVNAYPTYLFFTPEGELVHKGIGAVKMNDFIRIVVNATKPERQYFTLAAEYKHGKRDYRTMPYLAIEARSFGDTSFSNDVARDYIYNYLEMMQRRQLYTKGNFDFFSIFYALLTSKSKVFEYYLNQAEMIDSIEYKGYSNRIINYIIVKEEITPFVTAAMNGRGNPKWKKIIEAINKKYGESYSGQNVTQAKVGWYAYKKDWKNYAKYIVQRVEAQDVQHVQRGFGSMVYLNNNAFEVFKYSDNREELEKALTWVDLALPMEVNVSINVLDTKANILYKLGRKADGIALEEQAAARAPNNKEIQEGLEKMKKGIPTWPME